jgi:hypothetical protein
VRARKLPRQLERNERRIATDERRHSPLEFVWPMPNPLLRRCIGGMA